MRVPVVLGAAAVALLAARVARSVANDDRPKKLIDTPYAPSPGAAPFASLGYRELAADMLWVRLTGYYGGDSNTAEGIGGLVEAIITLDPHFARVYEWGARAMTSAHYGVDQDAYLRAIAILERGRELFPDDYRLPYLAGQIYTQDLVTNDPAQRRDWDEKGTLSIESALRKPGAPAEMAAWAAVMRTKLGEHQRAVDGLREMLLLTTDPAAQRRLLDKLAELQQRDASELDAELTASRTRFNTQWQGERPEIPATMYILLGARLGSAFDLTTTATGGRDLLQIDQTGSAEPTP